jgi:hypothetical protein
VQIKDIDRNNSGVWIDWLIETIQALLQAAVSSSP